MKGGGGEAAMRVGRGQGRGGRGAWGRRYGRLEGTGGRSGKSADQAMYCTVFDTKSTGLWSTYSKMALDQLEIWWSGSGGLVGWSGSGSLVGWSGSTGLVG